MIRDLKIVAEPIQESALLAQRRLAPGLGAVVYFLGIVRGTEGPASIEGIEYEAFQAMAEHQFELIFSQVEQRWPIGSVRLVHRVGWVRAGEPSLWLEVSAPHRAEALAACAYLVDEMKRLVPIWKKPVPL